MPVLCPECALEIPLGVFECPHCGEEIDDEEDDIYEFDDSSDEFDDDSGGDE